MTRLVLNLYAPCSLKAWDIFPTVKGFKEVCQPRGLISITIIPYNKNNIMIPLGISGSTFRTRPSSARSREVPSRSDRVRISRVTTTVTSSVYCSIFEKQSSSSTPPTIFSTSVRQIFHRSATVRLVIDRTVFASPPSTISARTNYLSVVYCATKFQRNESATVYCAHRFLRTSPADPTKHVALFPRIIGQGRRVKVIYAHRYIIIVITLYKGTVKIFYNGVQETREMGTHNMVIITDNHIITEI